MINLKIKDGGVLKFFEEENKPLFLKMWSFLKSKLGKTTLNFNLQ